MEMFGYDETAARRETKARVLKVLLGFGVAAAAMAVLMMF